MFLLQWTCNQAEKIFLFPSPIDTWDKNSKDEYPYKNSLSGFVYIISLKFKKWNF